MDKSSRFDFRFDSRFDVLTLLLLMVFLLSLLSLLSGCSPKRSTVSIPVEVTPSFSASGKEVIPDRWWTAFNDQRLNTLLDLALESNFDLQTAWHRLRAARALVRRQSSSLWPEINASLSGESSRASSDSSADETLHLGLVSEYEVDLWGRLRSAVDAQRFQAIATLNDFQTAGLTVSAEITVTWFQLLEAQQQLVLIDAQIKTNQKMLRLLKNRFGSGQIRAVDILRQKQLFESTQEQKITAESRLQVLRHQLAVLLGRPPQKAIHKPAHPLPELPPLPHTGIPSTLIGRRPDVRSAFNKLMASDRDLASAISNMYPRLSLTASLEKTAGKGENILKEWARSLLGNLLAPVFYGGRLKAEVKRTRAVKQQRLSEYGQTILTALREVEDALIMEKKQLERINSLKKQLKLTQQTSQQLRLEFFNGLADYLDVLTALEDEQQLGRGLLSAHRILLEYRIALYRALAGGIGTPKEKE